MRQKHGRKPKLTVVDDGSVYKHSRQRSFDPVKQQVKAMNFVSWTEVANVCQSIAIKNKNRQTNPTGSVIAQEFASHLKETNMAKEEHREIYLRDVSSSDSIELYFRHKIYRCQSNFFNSARQNLYFAPYFTRQMADQISETNLVPIGEGLSFVSRIKLIHVIDTRDVRGFLKEHNHPDAVRAAEIIRKKHRAKEVLMLMLGEPRLIFVSPVTKAKLAKKLSFGTGAMGSRSCTFDDLLSASQ